MNLQYVAWGIWFVAAFFAGSWNFGIRHMSKTGAGVTISTVVTTMVWTASVIAVPLARFSSFHLLWLFPLGFLMGLLAMVAPFAYFLQPLGRLYARLVSL